MKGCLKQILDHGSLRTPGPGSKPLFQPLNLTLTQNPQYSVTSDLSPVLRRLALSSLYPRIPFLSFIFMTYKTLYFLRRTRNVTSENQIAIFLGIVSPLCFHKTLLVPLFQLFTSVLTIVDIYIIVL